MSKTRKSYKSQKKSTKTRKKGTTRTHRKKSTNKTQKKSTKRKSGEIKLTRSNSELYVGNKLQTKKISWVSISDGYIYISKDNNRSYWILHRLEKNKKPKITFNDKTQTIKLASNKIVVKRDTDYIKAKEFLEPWSK